MDSPVVSRSRAKTSNLLEFSKEEATRGKRYRLRFSIIICVISCFSLFALVSAVYLHSKIYSIFAASLQESNDLETLRLAIFQLSNDTVKIKAPVSQVILTRDVDVARKKLRTAYADYLINFQNVSLSLDQYDDHTQELIAPYLDEIYQNIFNLMSEAEVVFTYVEASQIQLAGDRLSYADKYFRNSIGYFAKLGENLQNALILNISSNAAATESSYVFGQFILLISSLCFLFLTGFGVRMIQVINRQNKAIIQSREILRNTLNSVADMVIGTNQAGGIHEWNRQAQSTFGDKLRHCETIDDLVPGLLDYVSAHIDEIFTGEFGSRGLNAVAENRLIEVDVHISLMPSARQSQNALQDTYYVFTLRDISQEKQAAMIIAKSRAKLRLQVHQYDIVQKELQSQAEILKQAKQDAEASMVAKSRFLAVMSHELRTPMNSIIGFTQVLKRSQIDAQQIQTVQRIGDASHHLLEMINKVLDMSKLEAGAVILEAKPMSIRAELEQVLYLVHSKNNNPKVRLLCFIDQKIPAQLIGDNIRLRQILTNVISNAFQFTDQGSVQLHVNAVDTAHNTLLNIKVIDTGIGIEPQQVNDIFQPFIQADSSITRRYGGTGLGLSITKELVIAAGGSISVTSKVGQGSCFQLEIPYKKPLDENGFIQNVGIIQQKSLVGQQALVVTNNIEFYQWVEFSLHGAWENIANIEHFNELDNYSCQPMDIIIIDIHGIDKLTLDHWLSSNNSVEQDTHSINNIIVCGEGDLIETIDAQHYLVLHLPITPWILLQECMAAFNFTAQANSNAFNCVDIPSYSGRHILIVDDVQSNRELLQSILQPTHAKLAFAASGYEAIQLCEVKIFDVVIMDLHMPGMSGYDTSLKIKSIPYAQKSHIIGLTADSIEAVLPICIEHGMFTCLAKPIHDSDLYSTISTKYPDVSIINKQASFSGKLIPERLAGVEVAHALARIGQRHDLYKKLIVAFLERAELLNDHLNNSQFIASFRGAALSVGAVGFGEVLSEYQSKIEANNTSEATLQELIHEADNTKEALNQLIKRIDEIKSA